MIVPPFFLLFVFSLRLLFSSLVIKRRPLLPKFFGLRPLFSGFSPFSLELLLRGRILSAVPEALVDRRNVVFSRCLFVPAVLLAPPPH